MTGRSTDCATSRWRSLGRRRSLSGRRRGRRDRRYSTRSWRGGNNRSPTNVSAIFWAFVRGSCLCECVWWGGVYAHALGIVCFHKFLLFLRHWPIPPLSLGFRDLLTMSFRPNLGLPPGCFTMLPSIFILATVMHFPVSCFLFTCLNHCNFSWPSQSVPPLSHFSDVPLSSHPSSCASSSSYLDCRHLESLV